MSDQRQKPRNAEQTFHESRRIRNFLLKVGLVYAIVSIAVFFLFNYMLRAQSTNEMGKQEVRHVSQMVFESMYTAMLSGQDVNGIEAAAHRMSGTGPGIEVTVIRGPVIDQLFGERKIDKMRRINDLSIDETFKTGEETVKPYGDKLRFLYPAKFRQVCTRCHTNSTPGQVAGVVEIIYPIKEHKISINYVSKLMLTYFLLSFFVLIVFLKLTYRRN